MGIQNGDIPCGKFSQHDMEIPQVFPSNFSIAISSYWRPQTIRNGDNYLQYEILLLVYPQYEKNDYVYSWPINPLNVHEMSLIGLYPIKVIAHLPRHNPVVYHDVPS